MFPYQLHLLQFQQQHRNKIKIELPTFSGEPLKWTNFWKLFSRLIDKEDELSEEEKTHLLVTAMKDKDAENLARTTAANAFSCKEVVDALRTKYDCPRANFLLHMKNLVQKRKTEYNFKSMEELCVSIQQIQSGLESCQELSASKIVASFMEESFTDQLRHEWEVYSVDIVDPPTTDEIMEFLKRRMANLSISTKSYSSYSSSSHHKPPSTVKSRGHVF